jgi:hypothetical protein
MRDSCCPIGRPVRVVSISFAVGKTLAGIARVVAQEAESGYDLIVLNETWLGRELWFVLKSRRLGISARTLARAYKLQELRDHINRSRREIDQMRGWAFKDKLC